MISQDRESELIRQKDIILATLDYLIERTLSSLTQTESETIITYYQQQKLLTEKYYHTRRLDRLQQKLHRLTQFPRQSCDLNFATYIKERTGYEIDIFAAVKSRVDIIIGQNQIKNKKELDDVSIMLHFYKQHPFDIDKLDILKALLIDYGKRTAKRKVSGAS